jgi:hypothetical protein
MDKTSPILIDNIDGNTMGRALRDALATAADVTESGRIDSARIATAYFSPEGFSQIANDLANISNVRLMLGSDPIADHERWKRAIGESERRYVDKRLRQNLKLQEESLRIERDRIPFNASSRNAIKKLVAALKIGNMQVRRYEDSFLHAKAYIFSGDQAKSEQSQGMYVGSSNLTSSGLTSNLELNVSRSDNGAVLDAIHWFDQLWDEAVPFDLARFFEELFEPRSPFDIFLRVLWELYGKELDDEIDVDPRNLPLTSFQKHGVMRALRLIDELGGAIVADEVGLGKTFIAGEVLARYRDRRQRALLVCPASLRDTSWKNFISDFELYIEVRSFEELARDKQLWHADRRPNSKSNNLDRALDEYQLVIIDEAHNYRNPDSPMRADALRTFLYGKRKDVLMLTATPVNNTLYDFYHLIRFYLKSDSALSKKGILNIKDRFDLAMKSNPNNLSPDVLYPIVDATTVKRTRQFIKKHYPNDQVKINGQLQTIVFPEPKAVTVRYELNDVMERLFDLVERYLDPGHEDCLKFARYKVASYLIDPDPEEERRSNAVTGLLMSGLLKRFESSAGAFNATLVRLITQSQLFIDALERGRVVTTAFLKEAYSTDDEDFDELLENADDDVSVQLYHYDLLREHVEEDLGKLRALSDLLLDIHAGNAPKLQALTRELELIAEQAELEGEGREDFIAKRKVLIFSYYADTVRWIHEYLLKEVETNEKLHIYRNRVEKITGNQTGDDLDKATAAARFAPETAGQSGSEDLVDILISTDVLAEGVNLQQARHIINYDMPWNPMRLVQRHGRIDRIGSKHDRVFLRTVFPALRLDALLGLEDRISRKIALAAASVGVLSPIASVESAARDFSETREEIEKLLNEDASLFERGGTLGSVQTGEEYRQTLRKALETRREDIINMPWRSGSVMKRGSERGVFFCARVGERIYPRFIHTDETWAEHYVKDEAAVNSGDARPYIEEELGRCLRFIECDPSTPIEMIDGVEEGALMLWPLVRRNIFDRWMYETDPANLQPALRPLNREVAGYIRDNLPLDIEQSVVEKALDVLESKWGRRDEVKLREWFRLDSLAGREKSSFLVKQIEESGLEPFQASEPLPPIEENDIELIVWMAVVPFVK